MLPILIKLRIMTMAMSGWTASVAPVPLPTQSIATLVAGQAAQPVPVTLYDENDHQTGTVAIWRDGQTDAATKTDLKRMFRCRTTHRQKMLAQKTLAMLADISAHYAGRTVEYVSVYRTGHNESSTSPHRDGRAIDFRIRGISLPHLRDYVWRTYSDVGVGWYPSEQFVHIDTRPGIHDTSWTFLHGTNHYHPFWSEVARDPELAARLAARGWGS